MQSPHIFSCRARLSLGQLDLSDAEEAISGLEMTTEVTNPHDVLQVRQVRQGSQRRCIGSRACGAHAVLGRAACVRPHPAARLHPLLQLRKTLLDARAALVVESAAVLRRAPEVRYHIGDVIRHARCGGRTVPLLACACVCCARYAHESAPLAPSSGLPTMGSSRAGT